MNKKHQEESSTLKLYIEDKSNINKQSTKHLLIGAHNLKKKSKKLIKRRNKNKLSVKII